MNRFIKATCITIFLVVSLHTPATAQRTFIDSIRNMLVDLNEQIQFTPINQLLQHSIPFSTGDTMNDSLAATLKQLIADDCILQEGLLQPVSPHLLIKYAPLMHRITKYFVENGTTQEYNLNMIRAAIAKIILANYVDGNLCLEEGRKLLLQIQFTKSYYLAKWSFYLGRVYRTIYKSDSACILYKQSLQQNPNKTNEENILYSTTLFWLADFYRTHNKPDSAFLLFQQLLDLRKKIHSENSADYAYWLLKIADMYTYMAKYNLAQDMNFKALEITRNTLGEETNQYALCLNNIQEVYYRTGEYDKAFPYAQQSLAVKQKIFGNDYFDNVVNLHNLSALYIRVGLYNEAIPLLQESLAISKKYFGEDIVYASDLHQLAEVYEYLGQYDKALPLYQKALPIQKKIGENNFYYPRTLNSIASLFTKLGQYDKAIYYFILALEIKKDYFGEVNPEYTTTLNSYAATCLLKGDYKKTLSLQMQSLQLNKKLFGETHPNIATGLHNLAALYYELRNLQKAEEICSQSLEMQKKIFGERHPDIATSYDLLGNINEEMYHYNTALYYYQHAFEIRKNIMPASHPDNINCLYNLGRMYIKKGRIQKALQLLMEADSTALLHIQQSYTTLSEEEKSVYLHNSEKKFQYLPSLLYLHKTRNPEIVNRVYSNALVLKSMVLFHQQQVYNSIRKSGDSGALNLYNLWRLNKTLLGRQILLPEGEQHSNFDSLDDVTTKMEEQLSRISGSFRNNTLYNAVNIEKIVQQLSKDEAAIEFIRFRLFNNNWTDSIIYAALVLLPGKKNAVFVPLFEENILKKILRFSKNTGEAAINYLYPAAGKETAVSIELYRLVWQPLQSLLDSINTVYYSPCGLLCKISFAALHAGKGRMLADKYNLKQLLCTRSLALPQENKSNFTTASLWGNIDYNNADNSNENSFPGYDSVDSILFTPAYDISKLNKNYFTGLLPSLPGTKTETENIFLLLKEKDIACKLENKSAANEEQFKKMDGASPDLLHIATHGFFLPTVTTVKTKNYYSYENNSFSLQQNPMFRSGLLMAGANAAWSGKTTHTNAEDGVLTAYEIAQLDLSNTKLVILSACETALGNIEDNEGVYGLQRAFKMAGAKQVLMSLWKIPDNETSALMLLFYSSLLKSNDPGIALRHAQLVMKEKYPPYYWAGFVLSE